MIPETGRPPGVIFHEGPRCRDRSGCRGPRRSAVAALMSEPVSGRTPVPVTGGAEPGDPMTVQPVAVDVATRPRLARSRVTLPDGRHVGVAVAGRGVPLVVVHGFGAEGVLYAQTLSRLVGLGFMVVAVDAPGHGGTDALGA